MVANYYLVENFQFNYEQFKSEAKFRFLVINCQICKTSEVWYQEVVRYQNRKFATGCGSYLPRNEVKYQSWKLPTKMEVDYQEQKFTTKGGS